MADQGNTTRIGCMTPPTSTRSLWQRVTTFSSGRRGRWFVLLAWILLAGLAGGIAGDTDDITTSSQLPDGAQSTQAAKLADKHFSKETTPLLVTYYRQGGLDSSDTAKASSDNTALQKLAADTDKAPPPVPSKDGESLLVIVGLPNDAASDNNRDATMDKVESILGDHKPSDLEINATGPIAAQRDVSDAFAGLDVTLLLITAGIVAVLLLITYRSPLLVLLPLVSVGIANQFTNAAVYLLAQYAGLVVDKQSTGILTVLVFGVGTDYALLLISRYREELRRQQDRFAAMRVALPRTIPAVAASAGTVAAALLALLLAKMPPTAALGPVAAVGILTALLTMMTLLPALLVLCGRVVFWPSIPRYEADATEDSATEHHRLWHRVSETVKRRPRVVWLSTVVVLLGLCAGIGTLSTGLTTADGFVTPPQSVRGQQLITEHFKAGESQPVEVFTTASHTSEISEATEDTTGIDHLLKTEESTNGDWVKVSATLSNDPTSHVAQNTIERLRDNIADIDSQAVVGGTTATDLDAANTMERDLRVILPVILLIVFAILIAVLRAITAPVILLASVILSFAAALGGGGWILDLIGHSTIDENLILYGFLFLVALGVDYTIFLMTRAKEETARLGHAAGITHALTVTGGVITSAGIVLAATFSALTVMPLVFMMQIGVVVAFGVLLDTLIVRSLLVPALSLDLGRATWWPNRLARKASSD